MTSTTARTSSENDRVTVGLINSVDIMQIRKRNAPLVFCRSIACSVSQNSLRLGNDRDCLLSRLTSLGSYRTDSDPVLDRDKSNCAPYVGQKTKACPAAPPARPRMAPLREYPFP